jgi:predicted thioesterase
MPKVGTIGELEFVIQQQHCIDFAEGSMPAVLSTPWLIWFLENAARQICSRVVEPLLIR